MDNTEKKLETVEKDVQYFKQMITGAKELIAPWKMALILTNLFWMIVLALFICFAYLTPVEAEQSQDFPQQQQEQSVKGVG